MFRVLACITEQHDIGLVVLAGFLCTLACLTGVSMVLRARATSGRTRAGWLATAGLVVGGGIWATHFVAMLAYRAGLPVGYDPGGTFASVVIAMTVSAVGFSLAVSRAGALAGGAVAGAAIAAMHYVGMNALRIGASPVWDPGFVVASIVIGVVLSALALHMAFRGTGMRSLLLGGALYTIAIIGMHFTGMAAVTFIPDPRLAVSDTLSQPHWLALAIAALAVLMTALGLVGALLDYHLAARARGEAERLRAHVAELEQTKVALEATSERLSRALTAAAAANDAKAQFLAAMSHELRTPLNAIIGFSELMATEAFGPIGNARYHEYLADIRGSGAHLLSLINEILDLSRLDAGQDVLDDSEFSLSDVVAETTRMVRRQAEEAGIAIEEDLDGRLPDLRADRRRVRQVFINLITNAIKFTPRGGRICVSTFRSGNEVCGAIADTGIGISDIPKALERFGQIDSRLSRKFEGLGIGLPLAKQLMEAHGGRLEIQSEPDRGTTVTVVFPRERIVMAPLRAIA